MVFHLNLQNYKLDSKFLYGLSSVFQLAKLQTIFYVPLWVFFNLSTCKSTYYISKFHCSVPFTTCKITYHIFRFHFVISSFNLQNCYICKFNSVVPFSNCKSILYLYVQIIAFYLATYKTTDWFWCLIFISINTSDFQRHFFLIIFYFLSKTLLRGSSYKHCIIFYFPSAIF